MSQNCILSVSNFSKTFVISTEMQQIGNKKVEQLTKIGFLRIYFFNQFSENLNLPDIPFYGVYEKFDTDNTFL
jgi:hypothetical protein